MTKGNPATGGKGKGRAKGHPTAGGSGVLVDKAVERARLIAAERVKVQALTSRVMSVGQMLWKVDGCPDDHAHVTTIVTGTGTGAPEATVTVGVGRPPLKWSDFDRAGRVLDLMLMQGALETRLEELRALDRQEPLRWLREMYCATAVRLHRCGELVDGWGYRKPRQVTEPGKLRIQACTRLVCRFMELGFSLHDSDVGVLGVVAQGLLGTAHPWGIVLGNASFLALGLALLRTVLGAAPGRRTELIRSVSAEDLFALAYLATRGAGWVRCREAIQLLRSYGLDLSAFAIEAEIDRQSEARWTNCQPPPDSRVRRRLRQVRALFRAWTRARAAAGGLVDRLLRHLPREACARIAQLATPREAACPTPWPLRPRQPGPAVGPAAQWVPPSRVGA